MSEQMPLPTTQLTAADLDEWIAQVTASLYNSSHFPAEWARAGLAGVLGEEFPYRRYGRTELLAILTRARAAIR